MQTFAASSNSSSILRKYVDLNVISEEKIITISYSIFSKYTPSQFKLAQNHDLS